jgi:RNA polymerase sigma-70 factor (ECF subfamily)
MGGVSVVMAKDIDETITGRQESWKSIIERDYEKLLQYAFWLTRDTTKAEDVVQEAVYQMLKAEFTPGSINNLSQYLRKVMRNIYVDSWKKGQDVHHISIDDREHKELHNQLSKDPTSRIEDDLYYKELMAAYPMRILLIGFDQEDLNLLFMNAIEEMSAKEIAAVLAKDVREVRHQLNRMYAKVRYRARKMTK